MKKIFVFLLLLASISYSQIGYVEYNHPIHSFLERMSSQHLIKNYDPFELPKSRTEITSYLKEISLHQSRLTRMDKKILSDFLIEFEYDINRTTDNYQSLFPKFRLGDHLSQKDKFLYYYTDTNKVSFFVNVEGKFEHLLLRDNEKSKTYTSILSSIGGLIRGSFLDHFGFSIHASNGVFSGDRETSFLKNKLQYNFKFNENPDNSNSNFFDETDGYFLADFNYVKFKIGRDRRVIGYGNIKSILSDNPPPMDYLALDLKYSFLSFSFLHAKILGPEKAFSDSIFGTIRNITDKYIAYHRIGFNFSRHFSLGLGETIIYADRSVDFSYLNPFNYYKSAEHANGDRDNSQLFVDFSNNSVRGIKLYGTIGIDDIDFNKIGTAWFGNQAIFNFALYSSLLNEFIPMDFTLQYLRIDPYYYTHRLQKNNFTSADYSIGAPIEPNSETFDIKFNYRPHYRINLSVGFRYTLHGANQLNDDGSVAVNHGGDILVGHRGSDSTDAKFLDGDREIYRLFNFEASYEPVKNYFIKLKLAYENNGKQNGIIMRNFASNFIIFIRI